MRRFIVILVVLLVASCGSSKKVMHKKSSKKIARQEVPVVASKEALKEVAKIVKKTKKNADGYLNETTLAYIQQYAPLAMDEMRKFKIPASITLAQGILESGSGKSELSAKSNNHFGIKCHSGWKGEKVYHDDDAKGECFRKYQFPATSYQDHSLFLTTRFRYASLFKLDKDDYKAWAKGLKKAGYATDPKYPQKLIGFIEKYQLYQYDKMVLKGKVDKNYFTEKVTEVNVEPTQKRGVVKRNKKGIHIVNQEDTLYSISRKYGMSVAALKKLNKLTSNLIYEGEVLKLTSDAKREGYHVVKAKETLYSISKKYGLSVTALKNLNKLTSNALVIGQELKVE